MNTKKKSTIVFVAIVVGLIISPAVASSGAAAMKESVTSMGNSSDPNVIKTVMIVGIENPKVVPQIVHLKINDSVKFINQDGQDGGVAHDILSFDTESRLPNGIFRSTLLNVGDTFTVKFSESGTYYYTDSIFPQTIGVIVVS